ncbi:hypothetical protein EBPHNEJP_00048 [Salmonella phage CF-SP2]|nr:hypothetical protein EBPHNEJP_00048 [Salmonella phage CF-SP2]
MKLQRESIKDSTVKGVWNFCIYDKNPAMIELVEESLCEMEAPFTIEGKTIHWQQFCDMCPCYEDGYGSGFWIPIEYVDDFKKSFKEAKEEL